MKSVFWLALVLCALSACGFPGATAPGKIVPQAIYPSETPASALPTKTPQPASIAAISPTPTSLFPPHPLLGDVRVRLGIAYCTDKSELFHSVYPYVDDVSLFELDSFVPHNHWAYPEEESIIARYPYDPGRGQALFEEAGWNLPAGAEFRLNPKGEELQLTLTSTNALFRQTWMAVFEAQMKACGLHLLRDHVEAGWFYGEDTGLSRREFQMAAFAWTSLPDPAGGSLFQCDQIPLPENDWQGQNYAGWCNPQADRAIRLATGSLQLQERRQAYADFQHQFTQDLPWLPLFARVQNYAAQPQLQNFAPDSLEVYTWNAAQWTIPGKDTIVIGSRSEPVTLSYLETSFITKLLQALVFGLDYRQSGFDYLPVMLKEFPTLENGGAVINRIQVNAESAIVDAAGASTRLQPGVRVRNADGEEVVYAGGAMELDQLRVTYEFVSGLTWSDGMPVSKADYALAFRMLCDIQAWQEVFLDPLPACDKITAVDFNSDTSYTVTWKPGYHDPLYYLPPIPRLPAHQPIEGIGRLDEAPAEWWPGLDELNTRPMGVGPYVVSQWEYGKQITLTANPYYYLGLPATPAILIRFIEQKETVSSFLQGAVDVLGEDSIWLEDLDLLVQAKVRGEAQLFTLPSPAYELIAFALIP